MKETEEFHKRYRNNKNTNLKRIPDQEMAPARQRQSRTRAGRNFLVLFRNMMSLTLNNLCIYPNFRDPYGLRKDDNDSLPFLKLSLMSFTYFHARSCLIIMNRTRIISPAPAPDCLCPAGPTHWSLTFFFNRTSQNILFLWKVMFPGSIHPLYVSSP